MKKKEKSHQTSYVAVFYSYIGLIVIALEDGSTYYATFGEYALIAVGDHISFNKRQTRIININK